MIQVNTQNCYQVDEKTCRLSGPTLELCSCNVHYKPFIHEHIHKGAVS